MAIEQTLILIKPDGKVRNLTGLVIDRMDAAGLELVAARVVKVTEKLARDHYCKLAAQPFFPNLIRYIQGEFHGLRHSQVLALVYEGDEAIKRARAVTGATNPENAAPGTIRGSFGRVTTKGQFENVIHASGDAEDAQREVKLWFKPGELLNVVFPTKDGGREWA